MTDKKNHLVAKDNDLIEAKYRLSVNEQRLIAIMVSDIKPDDKDFKAYIYKISDLLEWLKIEDGGYYKKLRDITRRLISRCISIYDKKDNTLFQTSWLAGAKYHYNKGYIELSFHPDLKPYLLQLQNCFTQYALQNVLELKSKYAFRMYELAKQYQSIGKRKFQIDELRELLGLEKGELKQWVEFKRRVLEIAQREINKHTDIKIKYEFEKIARKFEYITIYITANDKKEIEEAKKKNERYNKLLSLIKEEKDRNKKTIQSAIIKYLKKEGYEYVERNILYANEKAEKNYRSFLIKALKDDWALSWFEDLEDEKEKQKESQNKQKQIEEYNIKLKQYKEAVRKRAVEIIESWTKEEYEKRFEEMKKRTGGLLQDNNLVKNALIFKEMESILGQAVKAEKIREDIAREVLRMN